jgi:chromosome segregation ATPase
MVCTIYNSIVLRHTYTSSPIVSIQIDTNTMTTWESARSPSPLRPPTGRPRSFASGLRVTSPSPRSHFVSSANEFDESSCCDETYVSQLSTRSDSRDHTSAETAGRFNDAMSPSRSILEKLKNDMNSLEMLRQTEFFEDDSENRHYNGGRVGRDFSSPRQNHQPVSSYPRSVDVTFRDSDSRGDSFASRRSLRSEKSWRMEKKSEETERALGQDAETDKLLMKVKILEEENERWQNSVSVLREDYVNNTRKLKEELQEAKTCEVELKKELLKAKAASEKEKQQIAENLAAATERHESELRSLCDKLRSAEETEKVLQDKIGSLELAIDGEGGLELLLQESKAENKKLQETIFLLDSELDGLRDIIDDTNQHNDEFKKALEHALEEKHQISLQLRDSENALSKALREHIAIEKLLEESRDESDEAKRALEDALDEKNRLLSELSDAENSHSQTKEAKDIIENLVKEITEESQRYRRDLEQATQENDAIKQLMSEEKNKAEEVRKNLEKKLTDYEAEINDLNVKSKEAKKNTEEQLSKAREAFAYEKETLNITLVSLEKEKEQCTSELQRLSHELAELNSQDVKATTELKISFEKHQKTKLELTKATDEVNNLRAKLSQKSDELIECSRQLSQSISEAEATKKQLKQAKEEKDQQENSIQELTGMTDTLKKKIDEVNAQAGNYKSKMDHYETQLKKSNATVNGSENKSKMLNEEITSLQTELSRLTEMIELAKNEKVGMQQSNNSICEKNNKLILENKELEQKLKHAEKETHSYKEQLTSALTSLDEMMKYIETSREEHDDIIQTLEGDLSKALDMKHATENKMNRLLDDMKKENDAMKEKLIKQAESSSEEYGRTVAELETAKKQKASEAASLKYKIQMLEAEIDQLKKETDERKSNDSKQREAYEVKLEKEKIDRAKLEEEKRLVVEKLRVTERENAELKEYLEEARMRECHDVEHKEQGNKIAELNASLQEKAAETTALQDEIKMLQAEVDKLSQSRNEEAEERKLYESEWARQQEEYEAKLEEEKQLTMNKLSAAEKENAKLKKSLEELGRKETQLAELKETLKQKTKNEIQLRGELAHKKQQMAISESNEKHLEEHVASLEAQIDQLISDYESKLEEMSETVM